MWSPRPARRSSGGADVQPCGAQLSFTADRRGQTPHGPNALTQSNACRWNWGQPHRSSCLTMPTLTRPCAEPWPRSTAMPARPVCARTACWCTTASTTPSPPLVAAVAALKVGPGLRRYAVGPTPSTPRRWDKGRRAGARRHSPWRTGRTGQPARFGRRAFLRPRC